MKLLKIAFVVLIHAAFVLKPQELSNSVCGGDYNPGITYYAFLNPGVVSQLNNSPLPPTFEHLYNYAWKDKKKDAQDNLKEWQKYFQNKPVIKDIKQLVYKAGVKESKNIKNFVRGTSTSLALKWRNNTVVKYLKQKRSVDVINYLIFAKKCEPFVTSNGYYDSPLVFEEGDHQKIQDLIINGNGAYLSTQNVFLKMRYAYQLVRLAHYSKNYTQAIKLYDKLVKPLESSSNSLIKYWALSHKAGVLMQSGKKAEGAYLFAKVFDKCPSRQSQVFFSFKVASDLDFKRVLSLCKTNNERATIYLLRGLKPYANAMEEIRNIYQLDPTSKYLELLLNREIHKMEINLLSADLSKNLAFYQKFEGFPKQEAIKYLKELQTLVTNVLKEHKVRDIKLWEITNCYLAYIAGKPGKALRLLNNLSLNDAAKRQAQAFKLAIKITQLKNIDKEVETNLFQQVKLLKHRRLTDYMKNVFQRKLHGQGDVGKAYLCTPDNSSLHIPLTMPVVDNLIAWEKRTKNKTPFEKTLNSKLKHWYKVKATMYLNEDKPKDALKYYKLAGSSKKLQADPKYYTINGFYGSRRPIINKYTQESLAEEMIRLGKNKTDAETVFELGNIYYNMTWFGNTWDALENDRSTYDAQFYQGRLSRGKANRKIPRNLDMSYPLDYFVKALGLAHQKGNKELAAKAAYMAAKCQQMAYQVSKDYDNGKAIPDKYLSNFKLIQQHYSDTQYYKEIVKECMYYNNFRRR